MTTSEMRYRRVLRLLPAGYRQAWEDDMVDTFLMSARKVSVGEIWSVFLLSVRLHAGGAEVPARPFVWRPAVRLLILWTLSAQVAAAAWALLLSLAYGGMPGEWIDPTTCLALYATIFAALLVRARWFALTLAIVGLGWQMGPPIALEWGVVVINDVLPRAWPLTTAFGVVALLQVIGIPFAFRGDATPIRPGRWLAVLALTTAAQLLVTVAQITPWSLTTNGLFVAAVGLLVAALVRGRLDWLLAAPMTAAVVTLMNAVAFMQPTRNAPYEQLLPAVITETALLLALAVPLLVRLRRVGRTPAR